MIKAVIIDDEQHCITALQDDIAMFCNNIEVIDTCNSASKGIISIVRNKPDLVFLDIQMPVLDGFGMLKQLGDNRNFEVIFTTAYDRFAIQAIKASAIDYLLKPVDPAELTLAIQRVEQKLTAGLKNAAQINTLIQNVAAGPDRQKLVVPVRNGYEFINIADIIYCRADGSYTELVFAESKMLVSKSLGELENLLPEMSFERIHYSLIINLSEVRQLKKTTGLSVIMSNGESLAVARSKKNGFLIKMGVR